MDRTRRLGLGQAAVGADMPATVRYFAIVLGLACGLLSLASALTAAFAVAMWLLLAWGVRGLQGRERAWALAALIVALTLRLGAVSALLFLVDPAQGSFTGFFGDGLYAITRSSWLRNTWLGIPIAPEYFIHAFDPYGWTGYHYVLAALQLVFGPSPVSLNLVSTFCFFGGVLLLFRLFRRSYGPGPALPVLIVLLFVPTLFAWSVSALKESFHFSLMAIALVGTVALVRGPGVRARVAGLLSLAVVLPILDTLRSGALVIVAGGLVFGCFAALAVRSVRLFLPCLVAGLIAVTGVATQPAAQTRVLAELRDAANRHVGHVMTPGQGFKLLDDRFYTSGAVATPTMTPPEATRFVIRGVVAFFVVPLPWQLSSRMAVAYLPEQIVWYLMVAFALVGLVPAFHRDALVTSLVCGYVLFAIAVIAPNSGNIGTLIRHRDLILPFIAWIAALGALAVAAAIVPQPVTADEAVAAS